MGYSNPCRECKHEDDRIVDEPCRSCESCNNYTRSPVTNADRIRAMTDEELVDILNWNVLNSGNCLYWEDGLDWLKQEVKNEKTNL